MDKNYLIRNFEIKIILFFLILIIKKNSRQKKVNNLEDYFNQSICQLLFFPIKNNCFMNFIMNDNFYNDILEIKININLLINIKISHLENIFFLLGIIPFLKNNSTLFYKINDKNNLNISLHLWIQKYQNRNIITLFSNKVIIFFY